MAAWRSLGSVVVALVASGFASAQSHQLAETPQAGDCFRIRLDMKLTGELRIARDGKVDPVPLKALAAHEFPERTLLLGTAGLPRKTARVYESAKASITVGRENSERSLRPERRLLIAQRPKDDLLVYSPAGPLTLGEFELTSQHFDTLQVVGLLPGKAVSVGDTWKISNGVALALCGFEGLTSQDLACKFEKVEENRAVVTVAGTANGIETGASVKLAISATFHFDLTQKRLVWLEWKQQDEREQGPASPATALELVATLTRTAIEQPSTLSDVALVSVPDGDDVPQPMVQLSYREPKGRFELLHGREWRMVGQTEEHFIFRLMDRGDFVAQVTLTPWTKAETGKHLSAEEFKEAMSEAAGWEPEQELQAGEIPLQNGTWGYRLSTVGKLDGLQVTQNFYLIASPQGEQIVLAFTMTPAQVAKLGTRDVAFVSNLAFPTK